MDIDGRFRVDGEAASGGMGTVFRGRDVRTGAAVAIKLLVEGSDERFAREASILSQLDHPAIVRYVAHGRLPDGRPYLVMDWVDGETVDDRLERGGLTIADTLIMGRRVADALGYAHRRGLVHRDVKPSNLMLPGGRIDAAAVVDFGIARPIARTGSLTETGAVVGTPSYMAPEQARGERDIGPQADVFALGCVLYECLTGRMAFEGRRLLALTAKIVLWDPPPARTLNAGVAAELDQLIARMLAKAPEQRPADGTEVAALLAAFPLDRALASAPRPRRPPAPTAVSPSPALARAAHQLAAFVVACPPGAMDTGAATLKLERLTEERTTLAAMLAPFRGRLDVLHDGSLLVCLAGDGDDELALALRAARCALAVRRGLPDALIAATLGEIDADAHLSGDRVSFLLEETVGALARDAMAMVFAGVASQALPEGAIRIDARLAALLAREYNIVDSNAGHYLGAA